MTLPFPEYPRPQLRRAAWQNLNGPWQYALCQEQPAAWEGDILVPYCIESRASGVAKSTGGLPLWYRRAFQVQDRREGWRVLLHFGAVDQECAVWVNGREAGRHAGGYLPFAFEITALLQDGDNELLVRTADLTENGIYPRGKQVSAPKGIWYTPVSGIWQTVWLEQVPQTYLRGLKLTPDLTGIAVEADFDGEVQAEIYDGTEPVAQAQFSGNAVISIPDPKLWTPETPHLYRLALHCGEDAVESYFGLRTFAVQEDEAGVPRFFLNGKPYFQRGLLDQGYWPDGLYTAPSDEALCGDVEKAKALGFNLLRKHIKTEPARWYYHCDRLGMLVWQDMPSGGSCTETLRHLVLPNLGIQLPDRRQDPQDAPRRAEFARELDELVAALYNVVSLCTWVPFNEGWGQFDSAKATARLWELDPTRPVDSASGWHDQGAGDYKSVHRYILKLQAPRKTGGRAFALTEYGGYSQVVPGHVWSEEKSFGYRMFPDREALTAAYRKLHEEQVLPLLAKGLCVLIYTQLTDVEGEVNGLFTYDRAVCKLDADTVRAINGRLHF